VTASDRQTIFALSSGTPPAAVAIVRISGPDAAAALEALAGRVPPPRRASLAALHDPGNGDLLDRALILFFPGPNSATGEDLAELHLHGGRSVISAVQEALGRLTGLRRAEPGEFTRRAFENGCLDLTEAEGIADLLMAETQSQRRVALAMAGGALSRDIAGWQNRLLAVAAEVEAEIDFSDEGDVADQAEGRWRGALGELIDSLASALDRPAAERLRDGVRVVIAGPPNAGKSTLMNALAGRDVAITSPIAGTTRDSVEAPVALGGYPFVLIDTAGLRQSEDSIEAIGVQRAQAHLQSADLILWLGPPDEHPGREQSILVAAKRDILSPHEGADVSVSAKTGKGLDELLRLLCARAEALLPREGEVALHQRHRLLLGEALDALRLAAGAHDLLIAAEGLRQARICFDRITGRSGVEDMLDMLFGRFCVGK
jgi:tRNA modification GTPase